MCGYMVVSVSTPILMKCSVIYSNRSSLVSVMNPSLGHETYLVLNDT